MGHPAPSVLFRRNPPSSQDFSYRVLSCTTIIGQCPARRRNDEQPAHCEALPLSVARVVGAAVCLLFAGEAAAAGWAGFGKCRGSARDGGEWRLGDSACEWGALAADASLA